ncbi:MAG: B12-binding domain-containing radical SAM protein [Lachnospiraceae bacterium]|jgi:radical SAM superfamily enzyme YgiQ (UPF0313 family)|nr:B12-binding domain-containing radical SAM protein [Lachnospiraceae bacterium]
MKTLLTAVNAKYIHSNPAVYSLQKSALAYAKKWRLDVGEVKVREFTINQSIETVYYEIMAEKADIVAFSVYIWNLEMVSRLCQDLKRALPELQIWLGGPEVSYGIAGKLLTEEAYDLVMEGEGEHTFFSLLAERCGAGSAEWQAVRSSWQVGQEGKRVFAKPIENLDELPYIYEDMTPFANRIVYYEASRGCPFHCAYCLSAAEGGVRELPLERVLKELGDLAQKKVRQIKLVDRTFNCHEKRAKAILQWIAELPQECPTNFHFEIEANLLSDELIDQMARLPRGRIQLEIGIQSTYAPALRACGRTERLDRIMAHVKRLRQAGNINLHVDLIAGLPLETYEIFKKSFDTVYQLKAHQLQLGFLKLLTGAPMNALAEPYGYVFSQHPPYEILKNDFLKPEELFQLKCIEDVLERLYNSGHFPNYLALLEQRYESPFGMLEEIAGYFQEKGRLFTAMGMAEVYQEMALFSLRFEEAQELQKSLLIDYYLSTPSDQLPEALKGLAQRGQEAATRRNTLLKKVGRRERKIVLRSCENRLLALDYTERDPVTGLYELAAWEET